MMLLLLPLLTILLPTILHVVSAFEESAKFRSFGQGLLLADISFSQSIAFPQSDNGRDLGTFPKPIYEIFHEYKLRSIGLTMSRTRWLHELWGEQEEGEGRPLGAFLSAVFPRETPYGRYSINS
jgi:hypothetical protein